MCARVLSSLVVFSCVSLVASGAVPVCVQIVRNHDSLHTLAYQCLRVLHGVSSFPRGRFASELIDAGAVHALQEVGADMMLQMRAPRIKGMTIGDIARCVTVLQGATQSDVVLTVLPLLALLLVGILFSARACLGFVGEEVADAARRASPRRAHTHVFVAGGASAPGIQHMEAPRSHTRHLREGPGMGVLSPGGRPPPSPGAGSRAPPAAAAAAAAAGPRSASAPPYDRGVVASQHGSTAGVSAAQGDLVDRWLQQVRVLRAVLVLLL